MDKSTDTWPNHQTQEQTDELTDEKKLVNEHTDLQTVAQTHNNLTDTAFSR